MPKTKHMKQRKVDVPALYTLLSYRRAHNSAGEKQYILDHIQPLNPRVIATPADEVMAFFVYVGKSNLLFTSHLDTVHMNVPAIWQDIVLENGLYKKEDKQPLGADDAAGNWLMFNMIHHRVPGVYAFFRGEERGGIGSTYCASHRKDLFEGIDAAIAFDRRGTSSVITHQGGSRGCSDEFGLSLASILQLGHTLDPNGIYTDTAEFFGLVTNCTNLSVGYENEHSKKETLNKDYIEALRDSLLECDWSKLDFTAPKPEIFEHRSGMYGSTAMVPSYRLFEPQDDIVPLDIADYLFDYADRLPRDLRDHALELSQEIYQRFE